MDTRENRIIAMIDFCEKNPYEYTVRQLSRKFRVYPGEILRLIEGLNLEVVGHKNRNLRREIIVFLDQNENKTAKQIAKIFSCSQYLVYDIARLKGIRLENDYSIRSKRIAGKSIY